MSFSQLSTELKDQVLSYLVNVKRGDCEVLVAHDCVMDGEQHIQYKLQSDVFAIDSQTRSIAWDQMHTAVLVALYVDGGAELRPSLHVPVMTDHGDEAARIAMASLWPSLRFGEVVIKTKSDPPLPVRKRRRHFSLLPVRSLATYIRILSTMQGGCLPSHCPGRVAPTPDNMLSETCYEVFIDVSGYDNSRPGTMLQLLAAFEPLHGLGNVLHLYDRDGGQRRLDEHVNLRSQGALRQWFRSMYDQLLFVKQLIDNLYLGHCDTFFGCRESVSVPLRIYDVAWSCFRFAWTLRSRGQDAQEDDQQWMDNAQQEADQLAVCAEFGLMSDSLVHGGSIYNALECHAKWPRSPDCGNHWCFCQIVADLGDDTGSMFGLERHAQYGLDKNTWLLMQHRFLVQHHLPDFNVTISHVEALRDDLLQLHDEMIQVLEIGSVDLAGDIEVLRTIIRQWRRSLARPTNDTADTLPIELLEGEEAYDNDITLVVLQRLSVAKRRELLVLEGGKATLRTVPTDEENPTILESDVLGSGL